LVKLPVSPIAFVVDELLSVVTDDETRMVKRIAALSKRLLVLIRYPVYMNSE